jgi:hypothetical protein
LKWPRKARLLTADVDDKPVKYGFWISLARFSQLFTQACHQICTFAIQNRTTDTMSTNRPGKKRPQPTPRQQPPQATPAVPSNQKTTAPSPQRTPSSRVTRVKKELIFNRNNYLLLAAAGVVMLLGIALMSGGGMSDPNVWDENVIYSTRRMVIAPIFMLGAMVLGVVAIFRK